MLIYCAHPYGGNKRNITQCGLILRHLQKHDKDNCYISPLHMFSFMEYDDMQYADHMEICFDLLEKCDVLYVIKQGYSTGVKLEIDFARKMNIPIIYDIKNLESVES